MKHQMCCVSLLAYLEGLHRLTFPDTHAFSLSSFERRVAAIERAVGGITAPPPHEAYSWNGIVWRLWRADLKTRGVADPELDLDLCGMAGMLDADYTTENLRRVVDRLGYDLPEIRCPREEDAVVAAATLGEDCEACLLAVVQKLAYVGGRLGQRPPTEPLSRGTIYAFAAWLGEGFGLYGTAPTSRPEAPIWSTSSNVGRATAARGDIAREQACPNSACNGRCAAAGPEYAPTGWTESREPVSSHPQATAFNERNPPRTTFHQGDPRRRAAFGQDMDHGTAFHQSNPRETALDPNGNYQEPFNQHNPQAGAFDFNFPPTTRFDHDSRPGQAADTDIPRDAGLGSNVHGRVAFDPDSPHRPGFAPPASVSAAPANRAPTPSRPASAGSDNGGPSVPVAAAQRPRGCRSSRVMGLLRLKKLGRK
ncbi:hypothetical protein MY4824_000647 [Beauveria thailandica]